MTNIRIAFIVIAGLNVVALIANHIKYKEDLPKTFSAVLGWCLAIAYAAE